LRKVRMLAGLARALQVIVRLVGQVVFVMCSMYAIVVDPRTTSSGIVLIQLESRCR
jgi:hypothetical protein